MNATKAHGIARIVWWVIAVFLVTACSKAASGTAPKWVGGLVIVWFLIGASFSIARTSQSPLAIQFRWVFGVAAVLAFLSFGSNGSYEDWSGEMVYLGDEDEGSHPKPAHAPGRALLVFARVAIGCSIGVVAARLIGSRK
jgi:hypothetical protein